MIDYNKALVAALNTILPTHYEMHLHSGLDVPCISYMELNNYSATETLGATVGYSHITYQVKVWSNKVAELQQYAKEIDNKLRTLGFKRVASNELYDINSTMMQKILTYECLALEEF
jgi:hypothetical protein